MSPDVLDLLPFRLRRTSMILLGFNVGASFMGWAHIIEVICTSKLKGADVLGDPPLACSINLSVTQHAPTVCALPYQKAAAWGEFPPGSRAHISDLNERHEAAH